MDNSFENVFSLWLEHNRFYWKESTYTKYIFITKNISKIFCDCMIEEINSKKIQQTVNNILLCNLLSVTTVKTYVSVINNVLAFAYDNDYDCVDHIKIILPKQQKSELKILTQKEQKALTTFLTKDIDLTKLGVLFALYTGVRCGELCALKWGDIDLFNGFVSINKTMQRVQCADETGKTKIIITPPKTPNSNSIIPLPKFLISILKSFNPNNENSYLLTGSDEKFIEPRQAQNVFNRCLSDCKISKINFHALRHSFATRCIELGMDYKTLSEILGHASVSTTMNLYVHSSQEQKRKQMNKLNSLVKI